MALAIKQDERNKVILLGTLTGLVLIVGIGRTMSALQSSSGGSSSADSAPATTTGEKISAAASVSGAPLLSNGMPTAGPPTAMNAATNASRLDDLYANATPGAAIMRDPFVPIAPDHTPQPMQAPTRQATPARPVRPTTMLEPNNAGFQNPRPFNNTVRQSSPLLPSFNNRGAGAFVQPVAPQISLAGVIQGQPSMAVLIVNARPYELTIGQKLPQGYVVTGITDSSVSLKKGNRTYRLEVGRALNGQVPGNLPMAPTAATPTAVAFVPSATPTAVAFVPSAGPTAPVAEPTTPLAPPVSTDQQAMDTSVEPTRTVRPVQNEEPAPDAEPPK